MNRLGGRPFVQGGGACPVKRLESDLYIICMLFDGGFAYLKKHVLCIYIDVYHRIRIESKGARDMYRDLLDVCYRASSRERVLI